MMSSVVAPASVSTTVVVRPTAIIVAAAQIVIAVVVGVGLRAGALDLVGQAVVAANVAQEGGVGANVHALARHGGSLIKFLGVVKVFGDRFEKDGVGGERFQM